MSTPNPTSFVAQRKHQQNSSLKISEI